MRVDCAASVPFAALEIRPWDDGYGQVDVEPRPGAPLPWPAIRDRFGPFEEGTMAAGAGSDWIARQPTLGGASVTLIVELDEDEVVALTIRRDRPGGD
jgi:hypothetical protein